MHNVELYITCNIFFDETQYCFSNNISLILSYLLNTFGVRLLMGNKDELNAARYLQVSIVSQALIFVTTDKVSRLVISWATLNHAYYRFPCSPIGKAFFPFLGVSISIVFKKEVNCKKIHVFSY